MRSVNIKLYEFTELAKSIQDKVIEEIYSFMVMDFGEDYSRNEVINFIKVNQYLFFENGVQADVTYYTGNHPRKGETVLNLAGNQFELK